MESGNKHFVYKEDRKACMSWEVHGGIPSPALETSLALPSPQVPTPPLLTYTNETALELTLSSCLKDKRQ